MPARESKLALVLGRPACHFKSLSATAFEKRHVCMACQALFEGKDEIAAVRLKPNNSTSTDFHVST